jgi:carbonic anhydrase/acetyltransferase-like protein (isoleucine patch superfamily)
MNHFEALKSQVKKASDVFIAEGAVVIGGVNLESKSSVWYNAVLRADYDKIVVGEGTNIQDGAVIHVDPGVPCLIGPRCTIGHQAMVHGCKIGAGSLIGIGATVLNRARIGKGCIIGAHALVPEGMEIPDHSMVMGIPGRVKRSLTEEEIAGIQIGVELYIERAAKYLRG